MFLVQELTSASALLFMVSEGVRFVVVLICLLVFVDLDRSIPGNLQLVFIAPNIIYSLCCLND